jgi:hypothetical protein
VQSNVIELRGNFLHVSGVTCKPSPVRPLGRHLGIDVAEDAEIPVIELHLARKIRAQLSDTYLGDICPNAQNIGKWLIGIGVISKEYGYWCQTPNI